MSIDRELNINMNTDAAAQGLARLGISVVLLGQLIRENLNTNAKIASTSLNGTGQSAARTTANVDATGKAATRAGGNFRNFAQHSEDTNKALLKVSSGAQGFMIGANALQGNLQGLAFSMIFLNRSQLAVSLGTAALTIGLLGTADALSKIAAEGVKAADSLQATQVQMNAYLQDKQALSNPQQGAQTNAPGTAATDITQRARDENQKTGLNTNDLQGMIFNLQKYKMDSQSWMTAVEDTATATGKKLTDVSGQIDAIMNAPMSQRQGLEQQFAIDFNLPLKHYATTMALKDAMEKRYAGSAALYAQSEAGQIGKLQGAWQTFTQTVGVLLQQVIAPFFAPILAFIQAMIKGFTDAEQTAKVSGQLAKNMQTIQDVAKAITPWLVSLGTEIGHVLFNAIMNGVHVFKTLIDTAISVWHNLKPIIDFVISLIQQIKKLISWIISWYQAHEQLAQRLIEAYLLLVALGKAIDIINAIVAPFAVLIKAIKAIGDTATTAYGAVSSLVKLIAAGAEGAYNITLGLIDYATVILDAIIQKLKDIAGTVANATVGIVDKASAILDGIIDKLGKIKSKTIDVITNKANGPNEPAGSSGEPGTAGGPSAAPWWKKFLDPAWIVAGLTTLFNAVDISAAVDALTSTIGAIITGALELIPTVTLGAAGTVALVAAIVLGLILLFPKQMGSLSGTFAAVMANSLVYLLVGGPVLASMIPQIDAAIRSALSTAFSSVASVLGTLFAPIGTALSSLFGPAIANAKSALSSLFSGDFIGALQSSIKVFVDLFVGIPSSIALGMFSLPGTIEGAITSAGPAITSGLSTLGSITADGITMYLAGNAKIINGIADHLPDPVTNALSIIGGRFETYGKSFVKTFQDKFVGVGSIPDIFSTGMGAVEAGYTSFYNWFTGLSNPFSGFTGFIQDAIGWVHTLADTFNGFWDTLSDAGKTVWGMVSAPFSSGSGPSDVKIAQGAASGHPLPGHALGGVVGGTLGSPQLIIAHGGEQYLGAPTIANGRGSGGGGWNGGGDIHIHLPISNSVITDESSMEKLANSISGVIMKKLTSGRNVTLHRVYG